MGIPSNSNPFGSRSPGWRLEGVLAVLVLLLASADVSAEIYKWKDAQGRLHFAQDLHQVPSRYREQAEGSKFVEGSRGAIQIYQPVPAALSPSRRPTRSSPSSEIFKIRVQRTGNSMRVNVRLNDSVTAPFLIDTGATDVSIPEWVARELGLDLEGARTGRYSTANGVIEEPLVTLDSVELGGARVEKVPAAVSRTMPVGLLGLSFFNHFRYRFDPGAGLVTLQPNGLAEAGKIRGGRSRAQWQGQYASLAQRSQAIERELEEINPNWARRKAELHDALEEVDRQYAALEDEADDARVPMQWRD